MRSQLLLIIFLCIATLDENVPLQRISRDSSIDCLLPSDHDSDLLHYCLRPDYQETIPMDDADCDEGQYVSFTSLAEHHVSVSMLLSWSIPIDIADAYGSFLRTGSSVMTFICNCTTHSFGRYCEYSWKGYTIDDIIRITTERKMQVYPDDRLIPAYELLGERDDVPLDYRDVCDGEWDLVSGRDEKYCHLIESHRCQSYESRCRNGLCIDHRFLFDGEIDCLDGSDEQSHLQQDKYHHYLRCYERASIDCDEHWCGREAFSCGDGQCVDWFKRFWFRPEEECRNRQSDLYKCTIHANGNHPRTDRWALTQNNGRCTSNIREVYEENSRCFRTILCGLTHHETCRTIGLYYSFTNEALPQIQHECRDHRKIDYSFKIRFLSPFVQLFHTVDQFKVNHTLDFFAKMKLKQPALLCLVGTRRCHDRIVTHDGSICYQYDEIYEKNYPYPPFDVFFCQSINSSLSFGPCANGDSNFYRCPRTGECISRHRLFDGFIDCLDAADEQNYTEQTTSFTRDRYRCGTENRTTGLVMRYWLGDYQSQCSDGTDEMSLTVNWQRQKCRDPDDLACVLLRSLDSVTPLIHDHSYSLSFDRLCDSVWDLRAGLDEVHCDQWICDDQWIKQDRSATNQSPWYGFCIDQQWICNEVWDFADGSDEYHCSKVLSYQAPDCLTLNHSEEVILLSQENSIAGNGRVECAGGLDERNTFMCSDGFPLNHRFLCNDQTQCLEPRFVCDGHRQCSEGEDETDFWCGNRTAFATNVCSPSTFSCLERSDSGPCVPDETRCNFELRPSCQKSYLDEYMCIRPRTQSLIVRKPFTLTEIQLRQSSESNALHPFSFPVWFCDRGLFVLRYGESACLCPPSFYGTRCEKHAHRITVVFTTENECHQSIVRIAILLRYENQTVDYQILTQPIERRKRRLYLNYPPSLYKELSHPLLQISVQFLMFQLSNASTTPQLMHTWQYPIIPSFLPAYRLAVVLRTDSPFQHDSRLATLTGQSQPNSICAPHSQQLSIDPLICICAANRYGPTCHLPLEPCPTNFCRNEGRCFSYMNESGRASHRCFCTEHFFGKHCEEKKAILRIEFDNGSFTRPRIIQLLDYHMEKMEFKLRRQHILLSQNLVIRHDHSLLPPLGLLKSYVGSERQIELDVLYLGTNYTEHQVSTVRTRCSHVREHDLMPTNMSVEALLIKLKQYHRPCQLSNDTVCFYDERVYLCFCHAVTRRASCFHYDFTSDRCDRCINDGDCYAGDRQRNPNDFVCDCPRCVYGALCQYRMDQLSFSLESGLALDLTAMGHHDKSNLILYMAATGLLALLGLVSNVACVLILRHRSIEVSFITRYIELTAIANQLALFALLYQTIYVTLNLFDLLGSTQLNTVLCKMCSYSLRCFVFTSKWLIGLLSIYRVNTTHRLQTMNLGYSKRHRITAACIPIFIFSFNFSEIISHRLITDSRHSQQRLVCVVEYSKRVWSILVTVFLFINHFVPLFLNVFATYMIIRLVARSKANLNGSEYRAELWKQIRNRYEQLLCPLVMIVCSMPELFVVFLLRCHDWESAGRRKAMILSYLSSFLAQMLTFCLFILPSKKYKRVFLQTKWNNLFDVLSNHRTLASTRPH